MTSPSFGKHFELFLFSVDPELICRALDAGVRGVVLDWEYIGKETRQEGADTQINRNTPEELRRVRNHTNAHILCRINPFGDYIWAELDEAIDAGADEIILPMVRGVEEVEAVIEYVAGRIGVAIMIETIAATQCLARLASLPVSRVYMGLNDLGIERQTPNIFTAVADGLVEEVRAHFSKVPFGFAGLTRPDAGYPIPCRLLIGEMARLGTEFTFLRRSFYRDVVNLDRDLNVEIPRILSALKAAGGRSKEQVDRDREELIQAICAWKTPRLLKC